MNPNKKERDFPLSPLCSALAEAVAAGAVLAVAGIAHVNGGKLAMHPVAVVLAVRNPAGNAAVDVFHRIFPPFHDQVYANFQKISENSIDKRADGLYNNKKGG